jgi:hypothetical protein
VGSLILCLSVGKVQEPCFIKFSIKKRKFHPSPNPSPAPHAQIDAGLTRDHVATRQQPEARWASTLAKIFKLKKKRYNGEVKLTTLDLWEGRGRRHHVFYIESVKVDA